MHFIPVDKSTQNIVCLASNITCDYHSFVEIIHDYPANILRAEFDEFVVYGAYLPDKKKHSLFDFILERMDSESKPIILAGDLNTGIKYFDQKGNSFWYSDNLLKFIQRGYLDAFRYPYGDQREYSW